MLHQVSKSFSGPAIPPFLRCRSRLTDGPCRKRKTVYAAVSAILHKEIQHKHEHAGQ
jgi:hypothetical protein